LDKREYSGPLYEQIDEALNFVLRNIRLGAKIEGIQRKEAYELPVEAIREMIVNAHCHRNMTAESCVQVAIYDDRLEVTSPGGLYNGLTFEEALQGHSKLRNRVIANAFSQIGLVEAWGTGLQRIQSAAKAYGLPGVDFIELPETFRVNLYRSSYLTESLQNTDSMSENVGENVGEKTASVGEKTASVGENVGEKVKDVGDPHAVVLSIISENKWASAAEIAREMSVTHRTVERYIRKLREEGRLVRCGPARGGYWEVKI
jgi:predicted HTH transcriptional regulator